MSDRRHPAGFEGMSADVVTAERDGDTPSVVRRRLSVGFRSPRHLGLIFGAAILGVLLFVAILAPLISFHPPNRGQLSAKLQAPSEQHWLGTDEQGRDLWARLVYGARVAVLVGAGVVVTSLVLTLALGALTSVLGPRADLVIQRVVDIFLAFPPILLVLTMLGGIGAPLDSTTILGIALGPPEQRLVLIVIVLGIHASLVACRPIRSAIIAIHAMPYIEAARCLGCSRGRIFAIHILPQVVPLLLVLSSLQVGAAILAEASLSFLGWGVLSPMPSWGAMLSGPARTYIVEHPALSLWPGLAIASAVLGAQLLADGLRDLFDPRLRRSRSRW